MADADTDFVQWAKNGVFVKLRVGPTRLPTPDRRSLWGQEDGKDAILPNVVYEMSGLDDEGEFFPLPVKRKCEARLFEPVETTQGKKPEPGSWLEEPEKGDVEAGDLVVFDHNHQSNDHEDANGNRDFSRQEHLRSICIAQVSP